MKAPPSRRARAERVVAQIESDLADLARVLDNCEARIVDKVRVPAEEKVVTTSTHDAPDTSARATAPPPPPDAPRALTPPATPSALARVSSRPPQPPPGILALDRVGEIVGILCVTYLCAMGRVDGLLAIGAIAGILGVQTGIRTIGSRSAAGAGVGLGALGLAVWHAPTVLPELAARLAPLARAVGLAALAAVMGCGGTSAGAAMGAARTTAIVAWPSLHRGADELGLCSDTAPCWVTGEPCVPRAPAQTAAAPPASPAAPPTPAPTPATPDAPLTATASPQ